MATSSSQPTQISTDEHIKHVFDDIILIYKDLTLKDFFGMLIKLMELAEEIPHLAGSDKKKIVKGVISQILIRVNIPNPKEKEVLIFLAESGLVEFLIDSIVKLTKEGCKINIPQIVEKVKHCIVL